MRKQLFSLIELLVVLAIIMTLATLMLPALTRAKEYAYDVSCKNNIRQIALSFRNYMMDYKNQFPAPTFWMSDFYTTSYPYTKSYRLYLCPKSTSKLRSAEDLMMGSDKNLKATADSKADYYFCGNASDNDKNNGLGNSPYKIDISNPGNSPTMVAFRLSMSSSIKSIYENMHGQYNNPKRNHLGYFNYIAFDTMRLARSKSLIGFFVLDSGGQLATVTVNNPYTYTYQHGGP